MTRVGENGFSGMEGIFRAVEGTIGEIQPCPPFGTGHFRLVWAAPATGGPTDRRSRIGSLDPAFVEVDQVGDADDGLDAVGASHRGERLLQEITSGRCHAFLDELAVP